LKTEKRQREPIIIPIVETVVAPETKPSFKTKRRRKHIVGSVPVFKTETAQFVSETGISDDRQSIFSVLRCKSSHDPTFGVYQDDTDGSFKIGR
jgi:hypothetical protein